MKLAAAWIALPLSLSVVCATPGVAAAMPLASLAGGYAATAPATMDSKDERAARAAAMYEQNRTVEAALGFEGLWKDYPDEPDFLFNAATSRFTAGHYAHAIARTDEFLALKSIGESQRTAAEAQRRAAVAQTGSAVVTVRLAARPSDGSGAELVVQFIPRDSSDLRPELVFTTKPDGTATLQLDPGSWTVRARAASHQPNEQRVEVQKGQTTTVALNLVLTPQTAPPVGGDVDQPRPQAAREVPPTVVRRSKLGFGVTGGVVMATGIGVIAFGSSQVGKARDCTDDYPTCAIDLSHGVTNRGAGTVVLGVGLGLMAGSLPWLARDAKVRKNVWIAETVVGGAAAAAGIIVLVAARPAFIDALVAGEPNNGALRAVKAPANVAGSLMLGIGAGAVISAITSLLVQRHHLRKVEGGAMAGRGQFGLTLSGRF